MLYIILNKFGILDPVVENLYDKYFTTCVVYWNKDINNKIDQAPFFSDKWLVVTSVQEFLSKECKPLIYNRFCDIVCEVSTMEEISKVTLYFEEVSGDYALDLSKSAVKYMKEWGLGKDEFKELLYNFQNKKVISSYKVDEKYIQAYIKWWLFTREGNQYGHVDKKLNLSQRWKLACDLKLDVRSEYMIEAISGKAKGNEKELKNTLSLLGIDILNRDFLSKIDEYFPKPVYLTTKNFPLHLFSRNSKKRKEILNLLYKFSHSPSTLTNSVIDWCNLFEKIHLDFVNGKLSSKNKDSWFLDVGIGLGINTEFKFKMWWVCLNTISIERVYVIKEKMQGSSFTGYKYLIDLCRKELK